MHVCFCCVCFRFFSVLSQKIGWKKPPKWPILCRVGRKTLPPSVSRLISSRNRVLLHAQVQLQNMLTSKFIAYFLDEVSTWQKKLSTADMVITIWTEVQRTWSHLESIFIGSEDIRKQLPDESDRFDKIDVDFKVTFYCLLLSIPKWYFQYC